jgi:AcrR family transcriptional regulator
LAGDEGVVVTAENDRIPPALYHEAALAILAQRGPGGLRPATLCTALGVPITRVDAEFGSWASFVESLLEYWEAEQTWAPMELALAPADPRQRVEAMKHLATTVPHAAEAAIRAWGHSDPAVRRVQDRVDAQRTEAARQVIAGLGVDDAYAGRLATMGIALLVGMQQIHAALDVGLLRAVLDDYERLILSQLD